MECGYSFNQNEKTQKSRTKKLSNETAINLLTIDEQIEVYASIIAELILNNSNLLTENDKKYE